MGWRGVGRITAAAVALAVVAGCSAGGEGTGQSPAPSPTGTTDASTAPAPTPTPSSISVKEYATRLAKGIDPLDSALGRLAGAKSYKGLERRVTDVESAAGKAVTALLPLVPPAELAGPNAQLVTALQAFSGASGDVGARIDARAVCTGAAARAGLGDAKATSDLRKALSAVYAKLPGDDQTLKLPASGQDVGSPLSNGSYVRDANRGGRAELEIENGGSADALVTLAKKGKPAISVYVRKGKTYTVRNVSDGTYDVFFSSGEEWDRKARAFGENCAFSRFADPMNFRTTRDARGIYWQNFRITLQPVIGGNAQTDEVDPDNFPDS